MFFPEESLRRGGRFYLCWVADSWPLRFEAMSRRQLWSQDIRNVCDDLIEVMKNESGRPKNRFSLRLSSQLMRGLVRLYHRKVNIILGDLCMLDASLFRKTNKKFGVHEDIVTVQRTLGRIPVVTVEEPENEQRVEEMIQNSGNVVANVQDITLKEAAIPAFQFPRNDGFGEERPEQLAQQLLVDRTMEVMLVQPDASGAQAQISGLELRLDATEKVHDKSRLAPHDAPQMERLSDLDVTMFRKSTAEEHLPVESERDIPEIPEVPPPVLPASPPEIRAREPKEPEIPEKPPTPELPVPQRSSEKRRTKPVEIELQELEDQPVSRKRRAKNKLIVDKCTRISTAAYRARIENPALELRCENTLDDLIEIRVPWAQYLRRCAHAGARLSAHVAAPLTRLYLRNLGAVESTRSGKELEKIAIEQPRRRQSEPVVPDIVEPGEQQPEVLQDPQVEVPQEEAPVVDIAATTGEVLNIADPEPMDISVLPTQKLDTLSQAIKRTSELEKSEKSPKKRRSSGNVTTRSRQGQFSLIMNDPDKENISPPSENQQSAKNNMQQGREDQQPGNGPDPSGDRINRVSMLLQEAGLVDVQPPDPEQEPVTQPQVRTSGTRSSETPLGSLDRTLVSLGDSVETTASMKFIRNQWGLEGTMRKILRLLKAGGPIDMDRLLEKGPLVPGHKHLIAARCFVSILQLKRHRFLSVEKEPDTLNIKRITLGAKFAGL